MNRLKEDGKKERHAIHRCHDEPLRQGAGPNDFLGHGADWQQSAVAFPVVPISPNAEEQSRAGKRAENCAATPGEGAAELSSCENPDEQEDGGSQKCKAEEVKFAVQPPDNLPGMRLLDLLRNLHEHDGEEQNHSDFEVDFEASAPAILGVLCQQSSKERTGSNTHLSKGDNAANDGRTALRGGDSGDNRETAIPDATRSKAHNSAACDEHTRGIGHPADVGSDHEDEQEEVEGPFGAEAGVDLACQGQDAGVGELKGSGVPSDIVDVVEFG